jgi:hypothetical protein
MPSDSGKLKIGDDWNAIRIIAFSQINPRKAIAEFAENSIDAGTKNVGIVRGKQGGVQTVLYHAPLRRVRAVILRIKPGLEHFFGSRK